MNQNKNRLAAFLAVGSLALGAWATPSVTIDSVTQRWPWNNKVDITYTVVDGQDVDAGIYCRLVFNATVNGETYVIDGVTNVGASASSGTHTIMWNPPSGIKAQNCSMTATLLTADNPSGDDYMVVNLQTGKVWYEGLLRSQDLSNARYNTALYKTTNMVFRKIARTADSAFPNGYRTGSAATDLQGTNTRTNWITYLDYYIGVFPVTQWQYNEIYGSNPSMFKEDSADDNHWYRPVDQVRWYDARTPIDGTAALQIDGNTFLGKLNQLTLNVAGVTGFDLPTKLMGEIAIRGGADTEYPWGATSAGANDYVVRGLTSTVAVGSKLPNGLGLYDTIGNVDEWALDDTSRADKADAPDPWTPAYSGETIQRHVVNPCSYLAESWRGWVLNPSAISQDDYNKRYRIYGFRVAFIVK